MDNVAAAAALTKGTCSSDAALVFAYTSWAIAAKNDIALWIECGQSEVSAEDGTSRGKPPLPQYERKGELPDINSLLLGRSVLWALQ